MAETIKPTEGRVVHYHDPNERKENPYPAIITHVWGDDCVNLKVMEDGSFPLNNSYSPTSVMRGDGPGQWNWMPYQIKKQTGSESGEKSAGTETI